MEQLQTSEVFKADMRLHHDNPYVACRKVGMFVEEKAPWGQSPVLMIKPTSKKKCGRASE